MHVLSSLRSTLAGPRRRLTSALMILTVIIGVVTMHSMSGSPTSHHHGSHHGSSVATQGLAPVGGIALPEAPDSHAAADESGSGHGCAGDCGGHGAAMAMCLMILVALLAVVVPVRRLLWRAGPAWLVIPARPAVDLHVAAPSLHQLCISRT